MFTTQVDPFVPARHPYGTLRVPLDVVRVVRTGVAWVPQSLGEYNISETRGMTTAIHAALCRLRSANQPMSPILVDLDIYYRLLGAAYWRPCADLPMRSLMRPLPLLFGICHAQKKPFVLLPPPVPPMVYSPALLIVPQRAGTHNGVLFS